MEIEEHDENFSKNFVHIKVIIYDNKSSMVGIDYWLLNKLGCTQHFGPYRFPDNVKAPMRWTSPDLTHRGFQRGLQSTQRPGHTGVHNRTIIRRRQSGKLFFMGRPSFNGVRHTQQPPPPRNNRLKIHPSRIFSTKIKKGGNPPPFPATSFKFFKIKLNATNSRREKYARFAAQLPTA